MAWTDGSTAVKNPGMAGSAALLQLPDKYFVFGQHLGWTTNNVAELTAIRLLLSYVLKNKETQGQRLIIYSDSEYAIGVSTGQKRASVNLDLVRAIREDLAAFGHTRVDFEWVKAHAKNEENNLVDKLAKIASLNPAITGEAGIRILNYADYAQFKTNIMAAKLSVVGEQKNAALQPFAGSGSVPKPEGAVQSVANVDVPTVPGIV